MLAVIGGTGIYSLGKEIEERRVTTKFGVANLYIVNFMGEDVVFIPRHGKNHLLPPHKINYRANIRALREAKDLDIDKVLSIYSAGIISKYKPEDLVLIEDFINFSGVPMTFYDDFSLGIRHKDFANPFNSELMGLLKSASSEKKIGLKEGGIIATTIGPRYETKAEISALSKLGANLVDMTSGFELGLLGENEIDFISIAVATNYAAGLETNPKKKKIKHEDNLTVMTKIRPKIENLIAGMLEEL